MKKVSMRLLLAAVSVFVIAGFGNSEVQPQDRETAPVVPAAKESESAPDIQEEPEEAADIQKKPHKTPVSKSTGKEFKVHFLDVGQGDSTLIQTPGGANILIDAGIESAGEKVVHYLKQQDVGKLDMVVATHPHADHIGGLLTVLETFPVGKFIDSGNAHTSQTYIDLLTMIDAKDIPFEVPETGAVYAFDNGFEMTVVHADPEAGGLNDASVAMRAVYGKVSFLLTGDAEEAAEQAMLSSSIQLKSMIYKAGHHGSNTSSTPAFVNQVQPATAILSYGQDNSYGHPNEEVVQRLESAGAKVYATAVSGDILVKTNGTNYVVEEHPSSFELPPAAEQPAKEAAPPADNPIKEKAADPSLININEADAVRLQDITGVGPVIAERIVDYRNVNGPFTAKEQLKNVKGIGDVTYEKMAGRITW